MRYFGYFASLPLLLISFSPALAQESLPDLIERIRPSVVQILSYGKDGNPISAGSGFFVSPNKIITNKHVVELAASIKIQTFDRRVVNIIKRSDAENSDLSLLETSNDNRDIAALVVGQSEPRDGDKIVVIGNPLGLSGSVSDGIVAAYRTLGGARLMQITAPISPGSSGSPVVNMAGQLVGIATLNVRGGQNLNFAIPASELVLLWEQHLTLSAESGNVRKTISPDASSTGSTISQGIRFDGIFAGQSSDFTQYIRFYGDGTVTTINLSGPPNYKAGRQWLSDKKLDHLAKGKYTVKDGSISFITNHKKQQTLAHTCTFVGLSLRCGIHNSSTEEDFVRVFRFATFSQLQ